MPLAVLELNDQALLIQAEGEPLYSEPGFAHLMPQGIETGEVARAAAWREPQHSYNQYWCHLNQTPLAAKQKWARHHADIAFAQLRHLWHSAGLPESLIVLVPGSFTDAQLSLLLGMVDALPSKALAVMDNALASCLNINRETLFVDQQLHQSVLTACRPRGNVVEITGQEVIPDLGMMQVFNCVARHISDLLIKSVRYDPLHASDSEQAIYNHLPDWLTRLRWEDEVSETLFSGQGELPFILRRQAVRDLLSERLVNMRSIIARHPGCDLVLSHATGLLAGVFDELSEADVASQSSGAENILLHHPLILGQIEGLHRVRSLDRMEPGEAPAKVTDKIATHVLYRDLAMPLHKPLSIRLSEQGVQLVNRMDDEAALTVVLKNGSLEALHRAPDTASSLPRACRPGESIAVGDHQLRLIEVEDA